MKKYIYFSVILVIAAALLLTSCKEHIMLKIELNDAGNLKKGDSVMMGEKEIGKVMDVYPEDSRYVAEIGVAEDFKDFMREGTKFYLVEKKDGASHIEAAPVEGNKRRYYDSGERVKGYSEVFLWTSKKLGEIKKGIDSFFESNDWKEFTEEIQDQVDKAMKLGKDEYENRKPEIEKNVKEFLNTMEKEYGKAMEEKVKPFVDSIVNELDKKKEK